MHVFDAQRVPKFLGLREDILQCQPAPLLAFRPSHFSICREVFRIFALLECLPSCLANVWLVSANMSRIRFLYSFRHGVDQFLGTHIA